MGALHILLIIVIVLVVLLFLVSVGLVPMQFFRKVWSGRNQEN